ncbi:MAG: transcriptional repressor LexA [Planctomycetota bacterium]|jgi:repressor LexA
MMKERLTPRQIQLLRLIAGFQLSHCYLPTISELACELGISRSTTFEHIGELRKKGMVSGSPGRARSLTLTAKAHGLLDKSNRFEPSLDSSGIPLVGTVAAGLPIEAVEDIEELSLSSHFGSSDSLFSLRVSGESMIEEDIHDGDYVICRRSTRAENGQLVVAIVDDENATLKRFYKEKDRARLEPANENFDAIYSENCRIEGIVVGLMRKF